MSRLNPLHDITQPMARLEQAMHALRGEMVPITELPDILASLKRVEGLLERLLEIQEAEAIANGTLKPVKPAPRKRAAAG